MSAKSDAFKPDPSDSESVRLLREIIDSMTALPSVSDLAELRELHIREMSDLSNKVNLVVERQETHDKKICADICFPKIAQMIYEIVDKNQKRKEEDNKDGKEDWARWREKIELYMKWTNRTLWIATGGFIIIAGIFSWFWGTHGRSLLRLLSNMNLGD